MTRIATRALAGIMTAAIVLAASAPAAGQANASSILGTIRITQKVMANGQPLPPGTYAVRMSDAAVTPVVGQSRDGAKWVEFVQDGQVIGKELATVVKGADVKVVVKTAALPAPGKGRVQVLRGGDYLRVWVNHNAAQYLVHLAISSR